MNNLVDFLITAKVSPKSHPNPVKNQQTTSNFNAMTRRREGERFIRNRQTEEEGDRKWGTGEVG